MISAAAKKTELYIVYAQIKTINSKEMKLDPFQHRILYEFLLEIVITKFYLHSCTFMFHCLTDQATQICCHIPVKIK